MTMNARDFDTRIIVDQDALIASLRAQLAAVERERDEARRYSERLAQEARAGFDALQEVDEAWDAMGPLKSNRGHLTLPEQISALSRENDDQLMAAEVRAEQAEAALAGAVEDKDEAYRQRNHLVAALARLFPSGVRATNIEGWSPDWHGCVYIDLPSGQISYHYHDSQAHLFAGLPPYDKPWDGHDKKNVHARLAALPDAAKRVSEVVADRG